MPSGTKTIKIHDDDNEDAPSLPSLQRLSGGKVLPKDKDGDGGAEADKKEARKESLDSQAQRAERVPSTNDVRTEEGVKNWE